MAQNTQNDTKIYFKQIQTKQYKIPSVNLILLQFNQDTESCRNSYQASLVNHTQITQGFVKNKIYELSLKAQQKIERKKSNSKNYQINKLPQTIYQIELIQKDQKGLPKFISIDRINCNDFKEKQKLQKKPELLNDITKKSSQQQIIIKIKKVIFQSIFIINLIKNAIPRIQIQQINPQTDVMNHSPSKKIQKGEIRMQEQQNIFQTQQQSKQPKNVFGKLKQKNIKKLKFTSQIQIDLQNQQFCGLLKLVLKEVQRQRPAKVQSIQQFVKDCLQKAIQDQKYNLLERLQIQSFLSPANWLVSRQNQQNIERKEQKIVVQKPRQLCLLLQTLITSYVKLKKQVNKDHTKKQTDQCPKLKVQDIFNGQNILNFIIVWNFTIACYPVCTKRQLNIKHYARIFQIDQNLSLKQMKIRVFVYAYLNSKSFKRIFYEIATQKQKDQLLGKNLIDLQHLYLQYMNDQQYSQLINYNIHIIQFMNEIVSELSSSQNKTLAMSFNCARFIIMYLLGFYMLQTIKKIQSEIQQLNGKLFLKGFLKARQSNQRWIELKQRIIECIKLSLGKIQTYQKQLNQNNSVQNKSVNARKLQRIYQTNKNLRQLIKQLKKNDSNLIKYLENQYNFGCVKKYYSEAVLLLVKQCCHKVIIERAFERLKKTQNYSKFFQQHQITLGSFENIESIKLSQNQDKQILKFILEQYVIYHLQNLKVFSLIISIPFYSMEIERQNLRRRQKNNQKNQQTKTPFKLSPECIFKNLDNFYIMYRKRFQTSFLMANRHLLFSQIYNSYMKLVNSLFQFISKNQLKQKEHFLQNSLEDVFLHNSNIQKPLHKNRMSVFNQKQCVQLFYPLQELIKHPLKLDSKDIYSKWQGYLNQKSNGKVKQAQNKLQKKQETKAEKKKNRQKSFVTSQTMQFCEDDDYLAYIQKYKSNMQRLSKVYKQLSQKN